MNAVTRTAQGPAFPEDAPAAARSALMHHGRRVVAQRFIQLPLARQIQVARGV